MKGKVETLKELEEVIETRGPGHVTHFTYVFLVLFGARLSDILLGSGLAYFRRNNFEW